MTHEAAVCECVDESECFYDYIDGHMRLPYANVDESECF